MDYFVKYNLCEIFKVLNKYGQNDFIYSICILYKHLENFTQFIILCFTDIYLRLVGYISPVFKLSLCHQQWILGIMPPAASECEQLSHI